MLPFIIYILIKSNPALISTGIDANKTTPSISVTVNSTEFFIAIHEITELDINNQVAKSIDFSTLSFTLTETEMPTYSFWNFSAILGSNTIVEVYQNIPLSVFF